MQSINPTAIGEPIDVWLKFYEDGFLEANTYLSATGYRIGWLLNDVSLVCGVDFDTLADTYDWYERNGYQAFSG